MSSFRGLATWFACIAAVIVLAIATDWVLTRLILNSQAVEAGRVGRIVHGIGDENEIPIFGASKAAADYVPDVLGPGYYNYGLPSASPAVVNLFIDYELRVGRAKTIVVELFPGYFTDIGDARNYIPFAREPGFAQLLASQDKWRWYYGVPGLRYFGSYDWYLKGVLADHFQITRSIDRGYSIAFNAIPWDRATFDLDIARRLAEPPLKLGMDPAQRRAFTELMRRAPQRQFIIVISPLHRAFLRHATGEASFRQMLDEFASLPNVRVFNLMRTDYPDEYFRDTGHLNYRGAKVFSAALKQLIESPKTATLP